MIVAYRQQFLLPPSQPLLTWRRNEERLQVWDVAVPNGSEPEIDFGGIPVCPARRVIELDENTKAIWVSGSKARVASRGVEREGIPYEEVRIAEENYRAQNPGKNMPDKQYRKIRHRPLLLAHIVRPYHKDPPDKQYDIGGLPLIALGLSFPEFNDSNVARRVTYRVNLIEWRHVFEAETEDDQPDQDDNAD